MSRKSGSEEPLRVVIADDEPLARERIRRLLQGEPDIDIVGLSSTGREAIQSITEERPDIVFLDLHMPGLKGLDVIDALPANNRPIVILVTAFDNHAVDAFDREALDYIVKPFDDARFLQALNRARARVRSRGLEEAGLKLQTLLTSVNGTRPADAATQSDDAAGVPMRWIAARKGEATELIATDKVDWIEGSRNYATVHAGPATYLVRTPLHELERRLDPELFARVHRSAIVNLQRVKSITSHSHGDFLLVLQNGETVRLSRARRDEFERKLGQAI